jgi:hypothetical protein
MFDQYPTSFMRNPADAYNLVIGRWHNDFRKNPAFDELDTDEKRNVETILSDLTGFMLYYQDCQPSEWTMEGIEHYLMVDLPRSLYRDFEYLYDVTEVLISFFRYLDSSDLLPGASDIARYIDENELEFYEKMEDPDNYSMRKGLLTSAEDEGIDTNDETAVLAYFKKIGDREMDGVDPDVTDTFYFILTSWVLPFSDSRYVSVISPAPGEEVTAIITILAGLLIEKNIDPYEWKAPDVVRVIDEDLILSPLSEMRRELFIPVIHAFFTFLAEEGFHPHAREIAGAILPLQEHFLDPSKSKLGKTTEVMLKHLFQAGVDIEDEKAVEDFVKTHEFEIMLDLLASENPELAKVITEANFGNTRSDTLSFTKPVDITRIPKDRRDRYGEITALTDRFCQERLDEDYTRICRDVAARMARKRDSQFLRGNASIWAAGIVYAIGQMNFLFDSSFEPYQTTDDICQFFGTKKSSTSQKAKLIRDIVGMNDLWDPEFSTSKMKEKDPFKKLRVT